MSEATPPPAQELLADILNKLPSAGQEMIHAYRTACRQYGMNPGIIRLFAVGSVVKDGGAALGEESDVDVVFSVEYPEESLSALPSDASSRSEAEDMRESRHERMLRQFDAIWDRHQISLPLNVPHGKVNTSVWGLALLSAGDFPADRPARLIAELRPEDGRPSPTDN